MEDIPRFSDGQPMFYNMAGEGIGPAEAEQVMRNPDRLIRRTMITTARGRVSVSTVFLSLDHRFGGRPPVLWETMTFGGPDDQHQRRYTSRDNAEAGHEEAVTICLAAFDAEGTAIIAVENAHAPRAARARSNDDTDPAPFGC